MRQDLHNALRELQQGQTDIESVESIAKTLVSTSLLRHKDKAVRIMVACCLADVLRIFAPNAPYEMSTLRVCLGNALFLAG